MLCTSVHGPGRTSPSCQKVLLLRKVGGAVVSISLWLVTATVLLLCVLLGRLFFAPIDVGFAREQIIDRAAAILPGWNVRFDSAQVGWDWNDVRPWVVLEDVRLVDRRNRLTATLPRAEVGLGFSGLLSGLGVSTIELDRASVHVADLGGFSDTTDDSLFDDLFGDSGIPRPEIFIPLTEAFNRFTLRLLDNVPSLNRVGFQGLSLTVYRGEDLSEANISISSFDLRHSGDVLNLAAQLDASIGGSPINIRLAGDANPLRGDLSLLLALNDVYPAGLPADAGLPAEHQYLKLPIDINLQLDLDATVGLKSAGIRAELGDGIIQGGDAFPAPAEVSYGLIGATYDVSENILVFDNIDLDLGGQKVTGEGLMYWHRTGVSPGLQFELRTTNLPVLNILDYWPIKRHPDGRERGARAWISQHMISGNAADIVFRIDSAPSGVGSYANDSNYQLTFDFTDLDTKFMQTMPPILGASGSAVLTKTMLDIDVVAGTLLNMPIGGTKIGLSNIQVRDQGVGRFEIFTRGDVQTVVSLIDNPPLRVAEKANLDISRLGGTATVKAVVSAPLVKKPPEGSVTYDVTAQLQDASVADLLDGEGLSQAQLSMRVTQDTLSAAGRGNLNGVPIGMRWEENFAAGRADPTAETTLLVVNGNLDAQELLSLGVDVEDFLLGKAQAEASFQGRNLKFTRGTFTADASTAILEVPQLAWKKPVGAPATINGGVIFTDQGSTVAPLLVQGDEIDLVASLELGPKNSGAFNAEIQARSVGRNQFIARLSKPENKPLTASVEAEAFDLGAFLKQEPQQVLAAEHELIASTQATDFDLSLSTKAILLENGEQWDDGQIDLTFRNNEPVALNLTATSGEEKSLVVVEVLDQPDGETGQRPFTAQALDGGQVLRGMGFFAHLEGGTLDLDARTAGWGDSWQLQGDLNVDTATLIPKSSLGDAVTEGTVSGLDSYLDDGDLELDVLNVPFAFDGDIVEFNGLKANGPTLGLTMEGEIATTQGLINVNGVVVPAYGINSLLGNIPLVGGLFSGGDGKGLFGVAYRVKGTTEEPDVNVNALSGLAPGFLRLLFEGRKGRVADVQAPDTKASPDAPGDPLDPVGDGGE